MATLKGIIDSPILAELHHNSVLLTLKRRQTLPVGDPDTLYYVRSGLVAAESGPPDGKRIIVELLYPGVVFAPAMLPMNPAIAYSPLDSSEIWKISADKSRGTLASYSAEFIVRRLNLQHLRAQLHIASLVSLDGEQRTAAFILKAACHFCRAAQGAVSFSIPMSRVDIADYLALNPDTLSRIMSRFVREKIMTRARRTQMTIPDIAALKSLCPLSEAVTKLHSDVLS